MTFLPGKGADGDVREDVGVYTHARGPCLCKCINAKGRNTCCYQIMVLSLDNLVRMRDQAKGRTLYYFYLCVFNLRI